MSFRDAVKTFADQVATERADVFGGSLAEGTADANGFNLQIGATKFRAAFASQPTSRQIEEQGFLVQADAIMVVRRSLSLTFTLGSTVTYLPTSKNYHVVQLVDHPIASELKVALRQLQP